MCLPTWENELLHDPDRDYLLNGLRFGFTITSTSRDIDPVYCTNYKSATCVENRSYVEKQIVKELSLGRYAVSSIKPTIVSALGAIEKPGAPHQFRLIHDASRPYGKSVNSYASPDPFHFVTVDNVVKTIKPGSYMCKVDLSSAFRHVNLHPSQYQLTGLQWHFSGNKHPTYMFDTRLPFGASESVGCFARITDSVVRMLRRRVSCSVFCYLDDFVIVSDSYDKCRQSMDCLIQLLKDLGFSINWDKVINPSQTITFLGICLNSIEMSMSIPPKKLEEIRDGAYFWANKPKMTKRELQSLVGKISWAARCVKAIRPMLRSLIDLQKRLLRPSHRIRLPNRVKQDILFFIEWSAHFNGVVFIPNCNKPQPCNSLYTDASLVAGAAYHNGDFLYSHWNSDLPNIASEPIYVKEICAILLAFRRWPMPTYFAFQQHGP